MPCRVRSTVCVLGIAGVCCLGACGGGSRSDSPPVPSFEARPEQADARGSASDGNATEGNGGEGAVNGGDPASGGVAAGERAPAPERGPGDGSEPDTMPGDAPDQTPAQEMAAPPGPFPGVRLVGRMDFSDPAGPRFAWSGTGAVATFRGASLSVSLGDSGNNLFTVVVDGDVGPTLETSAGVRQYVLASALPPGPHRVELYRRTEASFGVSQFLGFDFGADGVPSAPPAPSRRIELIGDSVSTGYGNLGTSVSCGFSAETQDHYLTYGAIAARELGAELVTLAWSGKGVTYNYDTDVFEPMPELYGRTLPSEPGSIWDFASLAVDAVVINLGTNDFSTDGDPSLELFASEYRALLDRVRAAYPQALVLCTVGPLLGGADLAAARDGIAAAVSAFEAAGGSNVRVWEMNVPNDDPGCDYHPGLATHAAMAAGLVEQLATLASP